MRVETITHPSGDQLPILLDDEGMPLPTPSEFVIGRRDLATNTLVRNLRELAVLYRWLEREGIDLDSRVRTGEAFTEAEIRGGLVEALRRDQSKERVVKKLAVTPLTFNQRLTTVRQFLNWYFDSRLSSMPLDDLRYERVRDQKERILAWLDAAFTNAPPKNTGQKKDLTQQQVKFLVSCIDPGNPDSFGRDPAVRYRNYVSIMIMLNYGLRPGELLSLWVEDIEFGAISAIRVTRRSPDPEDARRPRPRIKRNGRVMPIDNSVFARHLDEYIMTWREELEANADVESDYLILSDEGRPLSQSSITQLFQILRQRFPDDLPANLSAKSLRHTFSSNMERELRAAGLDEIRREEALAVLRGDSSLESQAIYIAQEVQEQANVAMRNYHRKILG